MKSRLILPLLLACLCYGQTPKMPTWLLPYPGAEPETSTFPGIVEASYTVAAAPAEVITHLRKLFDSAGVPFAPNLDGIGTSIRASVPECDLLLRSWEISCRTPTALLRLPVLKMAR